MTQFLSGPFCTQILADLGAEVIKLESPQGDLARQIPPHFVGDDSVYYISINRNKHSIIVDMKEPKGLEIARQLALASDVVIENYRPGILARLGLSLQELRKEQPALICCAISGFGQNGPMRDKPAYDMIVQALSGGMSLTGEPQGRSVRAGIPIADLSAGLYAAIGILAALHRRDTTGKGEDIDISMLDCQVAMLCYQAAYYLHSDVVPGRQGAGHDSIPTYRTFQAKDGIDVLVTANTERMWGGLCRALGRGDLLKDPRFTSNRERHANRHALWEILEAAFLEYPAEKLVAALESEEVPVGTVNRLDQVLADEQVKQRGMILDLVNDAGGRVRVVGDPLAMTEAKRTKHNFPPAAGQDTWHILSHMLGYSPHSIDELLKSGVVADSATKRP